MGPGRSQKEYDEAAVLAVDLLIRQANYSVNVIVTVVVNSNHEQVSDKLHRFQERLVHPRVRVVVEDSGKAKNNRTLPGSSGKLTTRSVVDL